jgi:hypothetical protein
VPIFLAVVGVRRWLPLIVRMAIPGLVAVAVPLIGDPRDTLRQIIKQPTYLNIEQARRTPWLTVVPHVDRFTIEVGWPRAVALGMAVAVAVVAWRVFTRIGRVDPVILTWLVGLSLGIRWVFEPLFFPYYLGPALVFFVLAAAASGGPRLAGVIVASGGLCYLAGWPNLGEWGYEGLLAAGLVVVATLSAPRPSAWVRPAAPIGAEEIDHLAPDPARTVESVHVTDGLPA